MIDMKNSKVLKLSISSMLAALVCVATIIFIIPIPLGGYINLGDGFVLLSGWILGPAYGFAAAAVGSALADVFSGYVIYAPATFLIKGLMAAMAAVIAKKLADKSGRLFTSHIVSAVTAEIIMVSGYYLADATILKLGFTGAAANIPWSCIQGLAGGAIATALAAIIAKTNVLKKADPYVINHIKLS